MGRKATPKAAPRKNEAARREIFTLRQAINGKEKREAQKAQKAKKTAEQAKINSSKIEVNSQRLQTFLEARKWINNNKVSIDTVRKKIKGNNSIRNNFIKQVFHIERNGSNPYGKLKYTPTFLLNKLIGYESRKTVA